MLKIKFFWKCSIVYRRIFYFDQQESYSERLRRFSKLSQTNLDVITVSACMFFFKDSRCCLVIILFVSKGYWPLRRTTTNRQDKGKNWSCTTWTILVLKACFTIHSISSNTNSFLLYSLSWTAFRPILLSNSEDFYQNKTIWFLPYYLLLPSTQV